MKTSLTREMLQEMQLPEGGAARVLAAHQEAMDALRSEFDAYRRDVEAQRTREARQAVIRQALTDAGANEAAVPLLALAVNTAEEDWEGSALRDAAAVLAPVKEQYAGFFAQAQRLPTDPIAPPLAGAALTLEDVRGMSAGEINENWSAICAALMNRN